MRMLRMAMRHTIEPGRLVQGVVSLCNVGLVLGLLLMALAPRAQAERVAMAAKGQSGTLSGGEPKAASPRGIPPHAPGYLGIQFADLSEEQAAFLHLKGVSGVEVINVDHDGPAGKAGLRPHDVIVKLNGQMVVSADMLRRMIHDAGVGAGIALLVVRGGKQVTVNAQLAYRGEVEREAMARMAVPDAPDGGEDPVVAGFVETYEVDPAPPSSAAKGPGFLAQMLHTTPFTGVVVEAIEPQLAGFFGSSTGGGLLVETVVPGSPAAAAGLRAGDVVVRADSIAVRTASEWMRRLHASRGQAIMLIVVRDKREIPMTLIPQLKKHSKLEWPVLFGEPSLVA
jgi:serine protease Do